MFAFSEDESTSTDEDDPFCYKGFGVRIPADVIDRPEHPYTQYVCKFVRLACGKQGAEIFESRGTCCHARCPPFWVKDAVNGATSAYEDVYVSAQGDDAKAAKQAAAKALLVKLAELGFLDKRTAHPTPIVAEPQFRDPVTGECWPLVIKPEAIARLPTFQFPPDHVIELIERPDQLEETSLEDRLLTPDASVSATFDGGPAHVLGFDAEWRPEGRAAFRALEPFIEPGLKRAAYVSVIQLSSMTRTVVINLVALGAAMQAESRAPPPSSANASSSRPTPSHTASDTIVISPASSQQPTNAAHTEPRYQAAAAAARSGDTSPQDGSTPLTDAETRTHDIATDGGPEAMKHDFDIATDPGADAATCAPLSATCRPPSPAGAKRPRQDLSIGQRSPAGAHAEPLALASAACLDKPTGAVAVIGQRLPAAPNTSPDRRDAVCCEDTPSEAAADHAPAPPAEHTTPNKPRDAAACEVAQESHSATRSKEAHAANGVPSSRAAAADDDAGGQGGGRGGAPLWGGPRECARALTHVCALLSREDVWKVGVQSWSDANRAAGMVPLLRPKGVLDVADAARSLGFDSLGLQSLAGSLLGVRVPKQSQMLDWHRWHLTPEMVKYAATDSYLSLLLFTKLNTLRSHLNKAPSFWSPFLNHLQRSTRASKPSPAKPSKPKPATASPHNRALACSPTPHPTTSTPRQQAWSPGLNPNAKEFSPRPTSLPLTADSLAAHALKGRGRGRGRGLLSSYVFGDTATNTNTPEHDAPRSETLAAHARLFNPAVHHGAASHVSQSPAPNSLPAESAVGAQSAGPASRLLQHAPSPPSHAQLPFSQAGNPVGVEPVFNTWGGEGNCMHADIGGCVEANTYENDAYVAHLRHLQEGCEPWSEEYEAYGQHLQILRAHYDSLAAGSDAADAEEMRLEEGASDEVCGGQGDGAAGGGAGGKEGG